MTRMYQRLGGLVALSITAGVSMLAGGVLLGGASADEPDSTPTTVVHELTGTDIDSVVFSSQAVEGACLIRFEGEFEASDAVPATATLAIAGQAGDTAAPLFRTGGIGGGVVTLPEGAGVEVRELTAEDLEDLRSTMQAVRLNADADECEVVESGDGVFTTPSGTISFKAVPATQE